MGNGVLFQHANKSRGTCLRHAWLRLRARTSGRGCYRYPHARGLHSGEPGASPVRGWLATGLPQLSAIRPFRNARRASARDRAWRALSEKQARQSTGRRSRRSAAERMRHHDEHRFTSSIRRLSTTVHLLAITAGCITRQWRQGFSTLEAFRMPPTASVRLR
jgi:hypothetical protein